jgi:hypothetical protein
MVNGAMPEGPKHHYIPVFYQKPWCGADRRLCEYSRPHHTVIARRKYPTETGFERGLYTLNAHKPAVAEIVENRLMRQTDQYAALAHQILLRNHIPGLDVTMRSGWARFILSLMRRTPEALRALGDRITTALMQEFPQLALPGDPGADDQNSLDKASSNDSARWFFKAPSPANGSAPISSICVGA